MFLNAVFIDFERLVFNFLPLGKKNFLPPSYLIYGFGFMFKVCDFDIFCRENHGDIPDVVLDHPNKASIDKISEAIHMFVFVFHWV